jgi:hypothetical protein
MFTKKQFILGDHPLAQLKGENIFQKLHDQTKLNK